MKLTGVTVLCRLSCVVLNRVMESLNLLRYLVIRDKVTENQVSVDPTH